jgi:hypothetical protein
MSYLHSTELNGRPRRDNEFDKVLKDVAVA